MSRKGWVCMGSLLLLCGAAGFLLAAKPARQVPTVPTQMRIAVKPAQQAAEPAAMRVVTEAGTVEMTQSEYLLGVLAGEMPASWPQEALKAQAVAARTLGVQRARDGAHADGDVCADHRCCQAYLNEAQRRELWGADTPLYTEKLLQAVEDTQDEILTYGGEAITVFFHSMSVGQTETCSAVFARALPYYPSVAAQADETQPNYRTVTRIPLARVAETLGGGVTAENACTRVRILTRTQSGRAEWVQAGTEKVSATRFRQLFSLRSTDFTLDFDAESMIVTARGSGHGVGMSQEGARAMAGDGADYRAILSHYYPGTDLTRV